MLQTLLRNGADPNIPPACSVWIHFITFLHESQTEQYTIHMLNSRYQAVLILLEHGADPDAYCALHKMTAVMLLQKLFSSEQYTRVQSVIKDRQLSMAMIKLNEAISELLTSS